MVEREHDRSWVGPGGIRHTPALGATREQWKVLLLTELTRISLRFSSSGPDRALLHGQKVAVSYRGLLHEATNLAKAAGVKDPRELLQRCGGWWLAEVEGYWAEDGAYVDKPGYVAAG